MDFPEVAGRLTIAERAVLRLLAEPMTTREIAERLALSEKTVENRRCAIAQKLGLGGRRDLTRIACMYRAFFRDAQPGSGTGAGGGRASRPSVT